jgi:hypothetical protein
MINLEASRLNRLLVQLAKIPLEVVEKSVGFRKALAEPFVVESDFSFTAGAGHLLVRLKPSKCFAGLVATARARHVHGSV